MPLLRPDIDKVLKSAGIGNDESPLTRKLDSNNLSLDSTIERLAYLTEGADSDSVKLRAIDTALKLHGALKDTGPGVSPVTIIINDPKSSFRTNPILIPRTLEAVA